MDIDALFYIYRSAKFGVVVLKAYILNCKGVICHRYMCIVLYIFRSGQCGVVVFKASMLDWPGGSICQGYMCIILYMYRSAKFWCSSIQGIYASFTGGPSAIDICALFCHDMCQVWCSSIQGIYA